ncbi:MULTISPECIES: DNA methyltransferase [unclassified Ruegeria]|uniref:site-specific DNA-methyltransferase n=1 Tax=unclassified Ruegeria TaxID=2625375 RepID=UPI0014922F5A|nr:MULTISPECIES: DNA methyltransferase [unclassified Ruegeria]NOD36627.1 ParB N-terminal domain-containing protein [Ruegeria sp. HKCCD7296]NOE43874.1 ParB N-terminal domain-containing protein [Ruegeria sp. HKCCD7319]
MGITFTYKSAEEELCSGTDKLATGEVDGNQAETAAPKKPRNDLLPNFIVEITDLAKLAAPNHQVRKPSKSQVAQVARSIRSLGFRDPPLVGVDGEIIDGETRVEAARAVGLKEIPCIVVGDLSEQKIRLLRIALNRIQERGEWNEAALKLEMVYLLEFEPDLTVTGFEAPEIDRLVILDDVEAGEPDPLDKIAPLPKLDAQAVTRPGDAYHLGEHRVLCGNARDMMDVDRALAGRDLTAVFTDPPYNLSISKDLSVGGGKFAEFAEGSGEMSETDYEEFLTVVTSNMAEALKKGGVAFLCIDWRQAEVLMRVVRALGLELINTCVWAKDKPGMGSLYRSQHELVLVAKRPGAPHLNNVKLGIHGRNRSNVWRYAGATGGRKSEQDDFSVHPTVKPVLMVRDAILDVTAMGDVVLDPFLGSGTTLLAAEMSKRVCAGIEISPAYVDVAISRWEKLTGLHAMHEETGLPFHELWQSRVKGGESAKSIESVASLPGSSIDEDF